MVRSATRLAVGLLTAGAVSAAACASPPSKELHQAQGAVEAARSAGASQYAPEEFTAAAAALQRAEAAVAERDYRQALNYALDARERAGEAARKAAENRALARGDAERQLTAADGALARATAALARARESRVPAAQLAGPEASLERGRAAIAAARAAIDGGDYAAAHDHLEEALATLESSTSESDAVTQRHRSRRSTRRSGR